jgi:hypothetical protein
MTPVRKIRRGCSGEQPQLEPIYFFSTGGWPVAAIVPAIMP